MGMFERKEDNQQEIQDWIKEDDTGNQIELKHPVRFWIIFTIVVGISLACAIGGIQIVYKDFMHNKANIAATEQTTEIRMTETISDNTEIESQTTEEEDTQSKIPSGYTECNETVWTTDRVNLRIADSIESEVIEVLNKDTQLTRIGYLKNWAIVQHGDKQGYISVDFITTEEPTKESAQTADSQEATYSTHGGNGNGQMICIDAGHQLSGDNTKEPNGPGSSTMKARVTSGTCGTTTGIAEYQLNLTIALQLQQELTRRGYQVCMTRSTHDVNISNMERAQFATSSGADICIRIHANGSDNSSVGGAMALAPSGNNPYVSNLAADSQRLSQAILDSYCTETGMRNRGVTSSDTMTGINWCTMPVTILEMGYMTNPTDDTNMQNSDYQIKMVQGIANGVDYYFQ